MLAGLILVVIVAVGACGDDEDAGSASSSTSTTTGLVACQVEGRTIAAAAEAHSVATGAYPASIEELVGE